MAEQLVCPVDGQRGGAEAEDFTGFFTEENPEFMRRFEYWSDELLIDPSLTEHTIPPVLRDIFEDLKTSLPPSNSKLTSRSLAVHGVRAVVARSMSYRVAMSLLPVATELVSRSGMSSEAAQERPGTLEAVLNDPSFRLMTKPFAGERRPGVVTDFNRTWYGDDARLLVASGLLTWRHVRNAVFQMHPGLKTGLRRASAWMYSLDSDQLQRQGAGTSREAPNPFLLQEGDKKGKWRQRHLMHTLNTGRWTALPFFEHSVESTTEHIGAYVTDALHGFIPHASATVDDWLPAIVANLHHTSAQSYMPNEPNGRAEYENRYVASDPYTSEGRYGSRREPLVIVEFDRTSYTIIPNEKSAYATKAKRSKRNSCPGSDARNPEELQGRASRRIKEYMRAGEVTKARKVEQAREKFERDIQLSELLRNALKCVLAGRYNEKVRARLDRPYSQIDAVTTIVGATACGLAKHGYATFDEKEVRSNLGPPESATSTGVYVLQPH